MSTVDNVKLWLLNEVAAFSEDLVPKVQQILSVKSPPTSVCFTTNTQLLKNAVKMNFF